MDRNILASISYVAMAFIVEQSFTILWARQHLPNRFDTQKKPILRGSRNPRT